MEPCFQSKQSKDDSTAFNIKSTLLALQTTSRENWGCSIWQDKVLR